jgi:heptosyltransferase II
MRLLVVMPSWIGDAVMATPALRLLRDNLPGAFIGGLARPGVDEVLAGTAFFDELHIERASGVMGPKHAAAKVRPRRYETALLFTNSFSTALITRIAGIPRRIGYNRDARGVLLTDRLNPPRRSDNSWAPIPAVTYYYHAARFLLEPATPRTPSPALPDDIHLELATTSAEEAAAADLLIRAGISQSEPFAILNPGGNNPAKRWPVDRFAAVGRHLMLKHGCHILVTGAPAEAELCDRIAAAIRDEPTKNPAPAPAQVSSMTGSGLGPLKAIIRRSSLMVTNDTGPRHIAAAFGVPVVSLFGPTDHRWTTIPAPAGEELLLADPSLPADQLADDHPERCRIEHVQLPDVLGAAERLLARAMNRPR